MTQSILNGFLIFGIIQVFVFVGLFVSKKNRTTADLLMSAWLLLFAVHSLLILVNLNNNYSRLIQIIPISLTLLYGPLLLMYIVALCPKTIHAKKIWLWHFLPFGIYFTLTFLLPTNLIFNKILALSGAVSGLFYCLLALSKLKKHEKYIADLFSSTKGVSLNWISKLVKGIVFIWFGVFVLVIVKHMFLVKIPLDWFFITIPLFISYIGYYGLQQQLIFGSVKACSYDDNQMHDNIEVFTDTKQLSHIETAYKKSGLQKQDLENIFNVLERIMTDNKLFLEPSLSLKELSDKVKIPQHHITQTLNTYAKQSFYDYVNTYRVKLFIEKLKKGDSDNFSLLGIAFDCGFNSKSSFNRIFKKHTDCSPSEYKNKLS